MTRMIRDMIGAALVWAIAGLMFLLEAVAPWRLADALGEDEEDWIHALD